MSHVIDVNPPVFSLRVTSFRVVSLHGSRNLVLWRLVVRFGSSRVVPFHGSVRGSVRLVSCRFFSFRGSVVWGRVVFHGSVRSVLMVSGRLAPALPRCSRA